MELFYLGMVVFIAGFTQGLSGFGSVLIALPLIVLFWDVRTAVPLVSLLAICNTTILRIQLHAHVRYKRIVPLFIAAVPGMVLGAQLLKAVQARYLEVLIGLLLTTFSLYLFISRPREKELGGVWKWAAGFLSGILGGSIGANGPPVIIYTSLQPWEKDPVKSTLVGYFMIAGIAISSIHAAFGLITAEVLRLFAVGFLPATAGLLAGSHIYSRMNSGAYRKAVIFLLFVMGMYMLARVGLKIW
ncbi:MAG: sulfite exporter TauE/SafE family protein [Proteobacteria bacterium]|nr:sulfite exporter TauE/SafE family protein [Pseudomonadota bacterium]